MCKCYVRVCGVCGVCVCVCVCLCALRVLCLCFSAGQGISARFANQCAKITLAIVSFCVRCVVCCVFCVCVCVCGVWVCVCVCVLCVCVCVCVCVCCCVSAFMVLGYGARFAEETANIPL